ncbi:hypothetical protein Tco_1301093 [Tanacetum coccineum]
MGQSRDSEAGAVSNMDIQPSAGKEGRRHMEDVHRFQEPQLSMSKRLLPPAGDRPEDRGGDGFPFKCFLDAYKGYHQIQMSKENEEKMAFYTDQGTYSYSKMSFGLKNAGATYQRLVDSAFEAPNWAHTDCAPARPRHPDGKTENELQEKETSKKNIYKRRNGQRLPFQHEERPQKQRWQVSGQLPG